MSDNTHLIRHQTNVYKIRINYASSSQKLHDTVSFNTIEPVIRAVLYAEERGRTIPKIEIEDYIVTFTKKYWKASEKLGFKQHGKILEAYPYLLSFTVDYKTPETVARSKRNKVERSRVASPALRNSSNNSCSSRRDPVVLLSKLNVSLKRQPVVVLERLNLPVSKKPDNVFQDKQLWTSPRRKAKCVEPGFDDSQERRKRHRDAILDENLPPCRPAKVQKVDSVKESYVYPSPTSSQGRTLLNGKAINHSEYDRLRSPRGDDSGGHSSHDKQKKQLLSRDGDSQDDSRLDRLRSPRRKSQVLTSNEDPHAVEETERSAGPRSPKEKRKRTSSGFWQLIETIMTPVKMLTRKRSK